MPDPSDTTQLQRLIDEVRVWMRDEPELNRLIQGRESSDYHIAVAIRGIVHRFNAMPPKVRTVFSWSNFPDRDLLIQGVTARLMQSVADLDDRNYFPASDGQVSVPSRQKGQLVRRAADSRWQEFLGAAKETKIAWNYGEALGGKALGSDEGVWDANLDRYISSRLDDLDLRGP